MKKKWFWVNVVVPLATLVAGLLGGKKLEQMTIVNQAQNNVIVNTSNFVTISQQTIQEIKAMNLPQDIPAKLVALESLAKSIAFDSQILRADKGTVSTQSDFWLPIHKTATVGIDQATLSVEDSYGGARIRAIYNGEYTTMSVGDHTQPFKYSEGVQAQYVYSDKIDSAGLYGFRIKYLNK